jgi:hypothetical protein
MKRFVTYLRQLFIEDISPIVFGTGLVITIFCWTIGIFVWGIDLLLLPVMFGLLLLSLGGPIILIFYLIGKNKGEGHRIKNLSRLKNLIFGTYLGFLLLNPITDWDEQQRQKSGLMISERLENFKKEKGKYPSDLTELKNDLTDLPFTYTLDKCNNQSCRGHSQKRTRNSD